MVPKPGVVLENPPVLSGHCPSLTFLPPPLKVSTYLNLSHSPPLICLHLRISSLPLDLSKGLKAKHVRPPPTLISNFISDIVYSVLGSRDKEKMFMNRVISFVRIIGFLEGISPSLPSLPFCFFPLTYSFRSPLQSKEVQIWSSSLLLTQ